MRISFHGAAGTVTGSQHLLTIGNHRVLLDCGLFQGRRAESFARNRNLPFDARAVDAVVLSHAHIDHSGNLPGLVAAGFRGPIHATHATRDLCSAMLPDSGSIQESDAEFVNRRRLERGEPPVEPLYTLREALAALRAFEGHAYERPFEVVPGVTVTYYDAGHILGSAITLLEIADGARRLRLCFTGDLGRTRLPILRDPQQVRDVDVLITESTYGDREHEPPAQAEAGLAQAVRDVVASGGKIIIPAFAVGRAQEIVYSLHQLTDSGQIPRVPIYVDSPLATNVSETFRRHPECYDDETAAFIAADTHPSPFGFDELVYVRSVGDSKALNTRPGPFVVISASGMAEAGRVLHHLRNGVGDERNFVLIVSWAAPSTLARRLADGEKVVRIFGEEHRVRAQVRVLHGYSAHADRSDLLDYAAGVGDRLRHTFIVHGEPGPAAALAEGLRGRGEVTVPQLNESFEV
jgi:metallo-beta-lactamase family protein